MQLATNPGYWGTLGTVADERDFVVEAERRGYSSVWIGEPYGHDAASVLGWYAALTDRLELGTSVLAMPGRTPAMVAQTAATLDALCGGRLHLGLGTSGPQVSEGWHGVRFDRPVARTREYVEVVRMALRREEVRYSGSTLQLPLPDGPGKALKLILRPVRSAVPIYLAALGPQNLRLCGQVADGWLPFLWAPEHAGPLAAPLRDGAAEAGRDPADIAVVPNVATVVDEDEGAARDAVRPFVALYVGGMGSKDQNFYSRLVRGYGFEEVAERVQELYLGGRRQDAVAAVPDELVDLVCLVGSPGRVADRMRAYADAGAGTLMTIPWVSTAAERLEQLRRVAVAAERSGAVDGAAA